MVDLGVFEAFRHINLRHFIAKLEVANFAIAFIANTEFGGSMISCATFLEFTKNLIEGVFSQRRF